MPQADREHFVFSAAWVDDAAKVIGLRLEAPECESFAEQLSNFHGAVSERILSAGGPAQVCAQSTDQFTNGHIMRTLGSWSDRTRLIIRERVSH